MTTPWSKELLKEIREDPKNEILHMIKGFRAVTIMSNVLFPDDLEGRHEWTTKFTLGAKRRAVLIVYAHTKRVNRDIIFSLITGLTDETRAVTGQSFTYQKGMQVIDEVI